MTNEFPRESIAASMAAAATTDATPADPSKLKIGEPTPGEWRVRILWTDGEPRDCFVTAPPTNGMPYDAEIMGDDEYREDDSIPRKLADAYAISATKEMRKALTDAIPALRAAFLELAGKYAGTAFENDPAYKTAEARYRNAVYALQKADGKVAAA